MSKDQEPKEDICDEIDSKLNDVLDTMLDKYPDKNIVGEMFLCLAQFAAELASHGGASEQEFTDSCRSLFRAVNATLNPPAKKLDPSMN